MRRERIGCHAIVRIAELPERRRILEIVRRDQVQALPIESPVKTLQWALHRERLPIRPTQFGKTKGCFLSTSLLTRSCATSRFTP